MTDRRARLEHDLVTASDIATTCGVSRACVSNWAKRHEDFPIPAIKGRDGIYFADEVADWLRVRNADLLKFLEAHK